MIEVSEFRLFLSLNQNPRTSVDHLATVSRKKVKEEEKVPSFEKQKKVNWRLKLAGAIYWSAKKSFVNLKFLLTPQIFRVT